MLPVAILAGGLATRLRPLTETVPKALLPIGGEPFLAHQLRLLQRNGVTRVVLCVGYLGERIRDFAGNGRRFGIQIEYAFDGPQLLGTGGAIRRALPLLGQEFFVVYGDSYLPCSYRDVEQAFRAAGKQALMTVFRNEGRWDDSNIEFAHGRILRYDKRARSPQMQHIDYGLSAFRADAFAEMPDGDCADLASLDQALLARDEVAGYAVPERFYEIGSRAGIEELEEYLGSPRRAIFLDRDGILNQPLIRNQRPYAPSDLGELKILPGAETALRRLKQAGFVLIVVTNQPEVARGGTSRAAVEEIHAALGAALPVDDFYACFHDGVDNCACRKPKPGMLLEAAARRNIRMSESFLVGDRWRDIDAGAAAGCQTVLVDYRYNERGPDHAPDYRAQSLQQAVDWILNAAQRPARSL
jgi:histidinol-phosphate phosphatase family protein